MNALIFRAPPAGWRVSSALLLIRFIVGIAFVIHGFPKVQHPADWMGPHPIAPAPLTAAAAFAEFGGGIALILGVFTSLAALFIAIDMTVALFVAELPRGATFTGRGHTYELALLYLVIAVALVFAGPGRFSIDARMARPRPSAGRFPH